MRYYSWVLLFFIPNFVVGQTVTRSDVRIPPSDWVMQKPNVNPDEKPILLDQKPAFVGSAQTNLMFAQTKAIKDISEKLEKLEARVKYLESSRSR